MSRSDFPPGYDDSRLLSNPQPGGGYPASVPPYGFNAYGGQPPYPQPNDPYRGQPVGYPPPSLPVIPVIPPGLGDNEGFTTTGGFDDISVRHTFIRKVYLILGAQLLVTATIVAIFTFVEPVGVFVRKNPAIYWVSYGVYLVTHLVLVCCKGPRRRFPWNLILLAIFVSWKILSHSEGIKGIAVFLALGITVLVSVAVTVFCFQTKVDFTKCSGFFCVLGIVVFVTGIITAIVLSFKYVSMTLHLVFAQKLSFDHLQFPY
uniref:Protein lifeguard 3-like n=1 Tax=Sinocyclocheilus grahami TaxID=75366 RepID=A0A672LYA9_SINGR